MGEFLGIPLSIVGEISGWGAFVLLAAVVVWQLVSPKGNLRTGREVQEVRQDRDARLVEIGEWRKAYYSQVEISTMLTEQNHELLSLSRTSARVLTSLPTSSEGAV